MPSIDDIYPSPYLKADDIKKDTLKLLVNKFAPKEVGQGDNKGTKLVAEFADIDKAWIVNKTNADKIGELLGTKDYTTWTNILVTLVAVWTPFKKDTVKAIRVVAAERGAAAPAVQHNLEGGKG